MNQPHCLTCGRPINRRVACSYAAWQRRKYCDMDCRRGHTTSKPPSKQSVLTKGRLDDVQHLLDAGESVYQIAARLGLRTDSLARWLDRHGRPDLARPFHRANWHERQRRQLQEAS